MTTSRRERIGVTREMIEAFGPLIFDLSINVQDRRGDPVRLLQFDEVERQRAGAGLADHEIAARLGLATEQVTFIRVLLEQRRFKPENYYRLLPLGGGRRFRTERGMAHDAYYESQFGPDALALRDALRFRPELVRREIESGRWTGDTVATWLARAARAAPGALAIAAPGHPPIGYAAALERAERLAAGLARLGLARGDVVTVQLPSIPDFVIAYYAVALLGGVLSTLHMPYGAAEAEPLLCHARARAVICGPATDKADPPTLFADLAARLPSLRHVIALGPARPELAARGVVSFEALIAGADRADPPAPPVAADPALMCYTSGTSAAPKAVPHSTQSLLANPRQCLAVFDLQPGDRVLGAAPLTHAFGLYIANVALMSGATFVPLPVFTPPALAELLERARPTHVFVAPAHLAALLQATLLDGRDLASVRQLIVSGSYCAPALKRAIEDKLPNGVVFELWGMTETFAVLLGDPLEPAALRHDWIGRATPGSEARITGEAGAPVPAGTEGELEVRGCSVFPGYFDNDAANQTAFTRDGWLRTGDLAVMNETGHVRITGRLKDIINRGGVKLNPSDVEALIDRHDAVLQSAIVPTPDPVLGERACCCVVLKPGASVTLAALCAWLERHGVAKLKWPERLEIVDAMPMTPTRKIIKGELAKRIARGILPRQPT
jgi:acyl-CoA synthetase (AMP-forming)/AMP-acid ligase II